MVDFWVYDVVFMALFTLGVVLFLYKTRKKLKRESGVFFLYRTKLGMKFIDKFAKKNEKILNGLRYVIISVGYVLMAAMIYMLSLSFYRYLKFPIITELVKAPPIAPLIPYFPKLFGLSSVFPPFYFTYFIVALAIVAIVHEFSHGIFMRLFKVKIKSTGFAFFGPIIGAFVEQDDKQFVKKKNNEQMTVLGAGVFANVIFALIFFALYVGFFFAAFTPAGYIFNSYAVTPVQINQIDSYGIEENKLIIFGGQITERNITEIEVNGKTFYIMSIVKDQINEEGLQNSNDSVLVFEDAPAFRNEIVGAITEIEGNKINNYEDLSKILEDLKAGEEISIKTKLLDEVNEYNVVLDEHPGKEGQGYLGIGFSQNRPDDLASKVILGIASFREPSTYYEPKVDGNLITFIWHLFYWVALINILVALFNMLPLGMLDGGRFFYLTILSLTKSEKIASFAFKAVTKLILLIAIVFMAVWFFRII